MRVIVTDTVDRDQWDEFVEQHPFGSIYHHSAWQDVIKKTYGYQPLYHLLLDESSNLQAAISSAFVKSRLTGNRIISYPFSDTCDPLVRNSEDLNTLVDALEYTRSEINARSVELRFARASTFIAPWNGGVEYYDHKLSIDRDPEALFRSLHKTCIQRAIKKAEKQDLEIITGETEKDLKAFYRLQLITRKKHGIPIQPFRFFRNLWNALHPSAKLTLLLARYREKVIAGIIVLSFKDTSYYKFGASDHTFHDLRANQLLLWKAIRSAQHRHNRTFLLGRSNSTDQGLIKYKTRWDTQRIPLLYFRIPTSRLPKRNYNTLRPLKKIISYMPKFLIRAAGELFYSHLA